MLNTQAIGTTVMKKGVKRESNINMLSMKGILFRLLGSKKSLRAVDVFLFTLLPFTIFLSINPGYLCTVLHPVISQLFFVAQTS